MAQPQPSTNRKTPSQRREEPASKTARTDDRKEAPQTSLSPGHRPPQEPTGAREQHEDNDDPMLLDTDYGENAPVYSPTATEGTPTKSRSHTREPNLGLERSFGSVELDDGPPTNPSFRFEDHERRAEITADAQRGLVAEGGGHSHGQEAQVGARLDDLQKQSPEQRRGTHQPRGDMPRGK